MIQYIMLLSGFVLMIMQYVLGVPSPLAQFVLFAAGVLLLGVPHGAADLLVASKNAQKSKGNGFSTPLFLITYTCRLVLFGLLLYYFPVAGNVIFIFFAAYHFGETDLHYFETGNFEGKLFIISYGLLILSVILLQHFEEVRPVLLQFDSGAAVLKLIDWIDFNRYRLMSGSAALFFISCFVYFLRYPAQQGISSGRFLMQYCAILFILYHLPMLLGFTFYFVVWHSTLSLQNIVLYLRSNNQFSYQTIGKQIALYSILAIIGIALFGTAGIMFSSQTAITGYLFLGLAVLTAPHMQIMHEMYQRLRSSKSAVKPST